MDPSFAHYPNTVLVFGDGVEIDLTKSIEPAQRAALNHRFDGQFAVLSASNPRGVKVSDVVNDEDTDKLWLELQQRETDYEVVTARSTDGTHVERSFACRISSDDAAHLAGRFDQTAFFWFDGDCFLIVESGMGKLLRRLPCR